MRLLDPFLHPRRALAAFLALVITGCGGYSAMYGATPTLTSIAITPSSAEMTAGLMSAHLTATGTYSDGSTADITNAVTWTTDNTTVASVSNTGVVTAGSAGTANVGANANSGTVYAVVSPADAVTVVGANLASIVISSPVSTVARGSMTTISAAGTFLDGSSGDVSGSVTWSTSDPNVAIVNASGIATAIGVGSCTISASFNTTTSNVLTLTVN